MKRNKVLGLVLGTAMIAGSVGCVPMSRPMTQREQAAGIGALAGGAGGAVIGSFAGSAVAGGLFGMPIGALAGYYIGDQWGRQNAADRTVMDEREAEIERLRRENERLRQQVEK